MPILRPESPRFQNGSEKRVWDLLRAQLSDEDVLISGLRFTGREKYATPVARSSFRPASA